MSIRVSTIDLDENTIKKIEKRLTYSPINRYASKWATPEKIYLYEHFGNYIAIPYNYSKDIIDSNDPILNTWINHKRHNLEFNGSLRGYQIPIVNKSLEQLDKKGTTTLNIYTGAGKTVIASYLSCHYKYKTLVVCTSTTLLKQWKLTFERFCCANVNIVGEKNIVDENNADIMVCLDTRISKISKKCLLSCGVLIIDEAHTFCSRTRVKCMLLPQPRYIIAASATMKKKNGMIKIIHDVCGDHRVYEISKKPFLVVKFYTGIHIPSEPIQFNKNGDTDFNKILQYQCTNKQRNSMIIDIILNNCQDHKILILTRRDSIHVRVLYDIISKLGIQVDYMSGNKKTCKDSNVFIGTINKIGTGFDQSSSCYDFKGIHINLLLIVNSIADDSLLEQVAGRVFRSTFPHIIHFVDNNDLVKKHWENGKPWYESRNGIIISYPTLDLISTNKNIHEHIIKKTQYITATLKKYPPLYISNTTKINSIFTTRIISSQNKQLKPIFNLTKNYTAHHIPQHTDKSITNKYILTIKGHYKDTNIQSHLCLPFCNSMLHGLEETKSSYVPAHLRYKLSKEQEKKLKDSIFQT